MVFQSEQNFEFISVFSIQIFVTQFVEIIHFKRWCEICQTKNLYWWVIRCTVHHTRYTAYLYCLCVYLWLISSQIVWVSQRSYHFTTWIWRYFFQFNCPDFNDICHYFININIFALDMKHEIWNISIVISLSKGNEFSLWLWTNFHLNR